MQAQRACSVRPRSPRGVVSGNLALERHASVTLGAQRHTSVTLVTRWRVMPI